MPIFFIKLPLPGAGEHENVELIHSKFIHFIILPLIH